MAVDGAIQPNQHVIAVCFHCTCGAAARETMSIQSLAFKKNIFFAFEILTVHRLA